MFSNSDSALMLFTIVFKIYVANNTSRLFLVSKVVKFNTKNNSYRCCIWSFLFFPEKFSSLQSVCLVSVSSDISATFVWSSQRMLVETGIVDKGSFTNAWPTLPMVKSTEILRQRCVAGTEKYSKQNVKNRWEALFVTFDRNIIYHLQFGLRSLLVSIKI
jgi:hypothetical protein